MSDTSSSKRSSLSESGPMVKKAKALTEIVDRVARDMGQWSALDDYCLIASFLHCRNPQLVYAFAPFCRRRSLGEIKDRWQCLLRDRRISEFVLERIQRLPSVVLLSGLAKVPLNQQEHEKIAEIPCDKEDIENFARLLRKNPDVFLFSRTPNQIRNHWKTLKKYCLLKDQETEFLKADLTTGSGSYNGTARNSPALNKNIKELMEERENVRRRAAELEREIAIASHQLWLRTGESTEFTADALATLEDQYGTRYLIKENKVLFGRGSAEQEVDIDLRMSGAGLEISRLQGLIQFDVFESVFYCCNIGSRLFYVNGIPLQSREKCRLSNNSLIEVSDVELLFTINITYEVIPKPD